MHLLAFVLLSLPACTDKGFEDDDDEVGLVKPDIDTDTDTEDTGDTEPPDTADSGDTIKTDDSGDEPGEYGQISLSDTEIQFTEGSTVAVTISNIGEASLSLSTITLSGEGEEAFSVGTPGAYTLAPDSSTTFSATFSPPLESGGWRAEVTIASDDPDNEESVIQLAGGVGVPQLDFDEDPLEISKAIIGCERIGIAVLRNDGGGFVEVNSLSLSGSSEMTLGKKDALPLSLLSGDTAEVEIIYLPTDEYDDTAYLLVATDDVPGTLTIDGSAVPYDEGAEFYELSEPTATFELSATPVETTLEVRVDGVDQSGSFSYDAKTNSVVFDGGSIPPANSVVEIEYAVAGGC